MARGGPLWHVGDVTDQAAPTLAPRDWSAEPADVLLADGTVAVIRSLREDDRDAVLGLHESVSVDTLRLRFFSPSREAGRLYVDHLFAPDNTASAALVALVRGRVAGLATAELLSPGTAEVAFLVADEDRGRGLGSLLLEHLAALGRRHGVSRFEAEVLGDNYGMLRVFRAAGFGATRRTVAGEVEVELRTDASREAVEAADQREWRAAARSLRPLLHPASVAVVGVRRSAGGFGHGVLDAIRSSAYAGAVHVVHPEADVIDGLPTVRSLADLDGPVDLVVVAVPADGVADVLRDAAANGAGAAVVISSGFSGNGSDERRHELLALARAHSLRLVGPNSQGVLANGAGLNATLLHDVPEVGGLAVASQSGGMGFALLDLARDVGLGVQAFVSLGDKVDVSSNDLLAAWMDDDVGRGGRALPRVVRQRAQVRPHRSPLRRAEAAAGRGGRPLAGAAGPVRLLDRRRRRRRAARPVGGDRLPHRRRADRDRAAPRAAAAAGRAPGVHRLQHRRRGRPHDRPRRRPGHGRRADVVRPERAPCARPCRARSTSATRWTSAPTSRPPSSPPRCAPCSTRARPTPSW